MTTIQLRIDNGLKRKAQRIADNMGMDLSSAIKVFLVQMVYRKGMPFRIMTENGFSPTEERRLRQEAAHALKYGKRYSSGKELLDDILGE